MNIIRSTAAYLRANTFTFLGILFAVIVLGTLAHAADSFTSAATFWASGPVGSAFPKTGHYLTYSGNNSYSVNSRVGSPGGFVWTNTAPGGGFGNQLMLLDANGGLHVNQLVGVAQTAFGLAALPTPCPAGQAARGIDVSGNVTECYAVPGASEEELVQARFIKSSQKSTQIQALVDRVEVLEKEVERLQERERRKALLLPF